MEITGKIIFDLGENGGTSKAGNVWKKREYVLETLDQFPKKVHFDFFGDRADQYRLNIGDIVKLSFDIESREYNGRWYTSIRGWKAEPADGAPVNGPAAAVPGVQSAAAFPPVPAPSAPVQSAEDDLPF